MILRSQGAEASGTALDPSGRASEATDLRGLSGRHPIPRRSPSGLRYRLPFERVPVHPLGDEWLVRGVLEAGYLGAIGDDATDGQARYSQYTDWSPGFLARALELELRRRESATEIEFRGLGLGRDDALYVGRVAVERTFLLEGFHSELPHPSMRDARPLYPRPFGTSLTLPAGLVPAGSSDADIDAVLAARSPSTLRVDRRRSGVDLSVRPGPGWELSAAYRLEDKKGERASGGAMFFAFVNPDLGSVVELPQPVDHRTHDLSLRASYADPSFSASLGYDLSIFDNDHASLTWENPFGPQPIPRGRLALEPDNHAQGISGAFGVNLPWRGRLTGRVSWQRMDQDQSLLPPTINPSLPDWNTTAALSRSDADAHAETLLVSGELLAQPWDPLRVRLHLRYYDRDYGSPFSSANPLLPGVSGYIAEDGGAGLAPQLRTGPPEFDRERLQGGVDLRLRATRKTALTLAYLRESTRREDRERNRVADDQLRIELSNRSLSWLTVRGSYAYTHRSGSPYRPDPNAASFTDAGGVPPQTAPALRKYDLASRDRSEVELRLGAALGEGADVSLSGRYRDDDYDAGLGLRSDRYGDVTLELFYQLSPRLQLNGYATYERRRLRQKGRNLGASPPDAGDWTLSSDATSVSAGAGIETAPHRLVRWSFSYDWVHSVDEQPYEFASLAALSPFGGPSAAASGSGFPDLRVDDHVIATTLLLGPRDPWSLSIFYRFVLSRIDDYHQTDLPTRSDHRIFFGHQDRSYDAHAIGATVRVEY